MDVPSSWPDVDVRWVHQLVLHHRAGDAAQGKAGKTQVAAARKQAQSWLVAHKPLGFELTERCSLCHPHCALSKHSCRYSTDDGLLQAHKVARNKHKTELATPALLCVAGSGQHQLHVTGAQSQPDSNSTSQSISNTNRKQRSSSRGDVLCTMADQHVPNLCLSQTTCKCSHGTLL